MQWHDVAFLHWPVSVTALRPLIPASLQIDTYDGTAWVGIVPFRMERVRLRTAPPVPTTHSFPELNVRTYVRAAGRAGVWFFSLDAASRLAVRGARFLYNLPYFDARMRVAADGDAVVYRSERTHKGAASAEFAGRYAPTAAVYEATPETLDHFLVERYCLFTYDRHRGTGIIDIDHPPWPLQRGVVDTATNTMAAAAGITLPARKPLVHFARALEVHAWTRRPLE